jgi:oxygen-independent coproporphyrinogen-3 oxidase
MTAPTYRLTEAQRQTYRRHASLALPRHTSYPIAAVWTTDYGPVQFAEALRDLARGDRRLSLYVHVPFCEQLCYYCACTKEIVPSHKRRQEDPAERFLAGLEREAARIGCIVGDCRVQQLHLGGGTPTFLTPAQLDRLGAILSGSFAIADAEEKAVEIDPRATTAAHLETLRGLGFNRVSLGVQDFSDRVQRAVHRVQPFDVVARCVEQARALGFTSINFDLIYGLPFQTVESMADTLEKTLLLAPDRIAFYRLAVIPEMFRWQNVFRAEDLPSADLPLELNLLAINTFLDAGYAFIGLDHFARPGEALSTACESRGVQRNFQGMTTGKNLALVGLGPSAISQFDQAFAQNHKTTADWVDALENGFATQRGLRLSEDDRLRQELLQQLYSHGKVDLDELANQFQIDWRETFDVEIESLAELEAGGLVEIEEAMIRLTEPLGRLLVRVVAAVFDRYLPADAYRVGLPAQKASAVG